MTKDDKKISSEMKAQSDYSTPISRHRMQQSSMKITSLCNKRTKNITRIFPLSIMKQVVQKEQRFCTKKRLLRVVKMNAKPDHSIDTKTL